MDTLKENVNHSRLYHFTDAKTALKIIQDDALLVGGNYVFNTDKGKCICLSRSFNFIKSRINKGSVIFVLNKDLLQTKYKIVPVSDTKNMTNKRARFTTDSKAEELVFNDITNLHKYIDKILVTDEVYDIYKKIVPEINITKISDYKINEDVNMDNNINRQKGLQIYYWLEDKGLDVDYSDWGEIFYYTFENRNDYENAIYLLNAYCGHKAVTSTDDNRLEITVDVAGAYTKLKNNVNSQYMDENINEGKEDARFTVKLYTDTNKWNSEVVNNLKLEKNKQALLAYKEIMNEVVLLPIQTLYDRKILKQLQSTIKKMVEIKWNIGKVQYRIVCRREDNTLYLLVPFIKSNTDKDTDKAVATAIKRFRLIGEDLSSAKSLDISLLNNLIDELIKDADNDNQFMDSDDSVTEQLLESDNVEDDLEDIIRDTIEENSNENTKIRLFEITTEPENPTRAKDEEEMYVVDFDDMKTDFRKLTIYPYEETEDGANKPVASFMLSGGLNGCGNWTDYLDDLQKLFEKLKEATGLEPLVYEESTDIADDVWDVKVFMYDHSKNDEDYPLDEGLFNPQKSDEDTIIDNMIDYYDDYMQHDGCLESILDKVLTKNNYNIEDYDTIDQVPREVWLDFYEATKDYYQKEVDKYGDAAEIPTEAFAVFNLNSFDPEKKDINYNEDLEKLINFWYENAIGNFKVDWLNGYQIKTIDTYSNDKTPYIWQINKDNNVLTVINADTNKIINRWDSVDAYIDECNELNGYEDDDDLDEDLNEEVVYQTAPEELQDGFEKGMQDLGWSFDNNTRDGRSKTEYEPWDSDLVNNAKNIHYQYISNNAFESEDELNTFMDATFSFIDDIEDKYNCRFLYSGGLITEGKFKNHESLALDLKPIMYRTDEGPSPKYPGQSLRLYKGKPVRDSDKALIKDISNRMHMTDDEILSNVSDAKKEEDLDEDVDLDETYSKKELHDFRNKVFNQQKIMTIYRKKKYGKKRLLCRTRCVNCGREKKLFLSNLVKNPEKYGSCVCSDKNINARMDTIKDLYKGKKVLKSNTSGYTGVYWVAKYRGEPYNKWRAYIEVDGHRNYLGDFSSKSKAIRARRAAAKKGLDWYNTNKNQFMATSRRAHKKTRNKNYKKTK